MDGCTSATTDYSELLLRALSAAEACKRLMTSVLKTLLSSDALRRAVRDGFRFEEGEERHCGVQDEKAFGKQYWKII